jgi:hypothetical protein
MRRASSALRPSGLVTSTALPAAAAAATASSWRKFGTPTTTTSVSGCSTAARRSVVCSGMSHRSLKAAPRSSVRE